MSVPAGLVRRPYPCRAASQTIRSFDRLAIVAIRGRADPQLGKCCHEAVKLDGVSTEALATPDPVDAGPWPAPAAAGPTPAA
ncbi:MAG: hypothetical protein ACYCPD_15295, partial [Acidobacteriaceae bacterium]